MRAKLKDLTLNKDGSQNLTVILYGFDFGEKYDQLRDKDLDVEIREHREKRSKNANAYFHVLVNKIARETGESNEAVKKRLVESYGVVDTLEDGSTFGFMLPAKADIRKLKKYTQWVENRMQHGKLYSVYLVLKETHDMDTKEMARLIDGAIEEARDLGIETDTPEELARRKEQWAAYEAAHGKETYDEQS